MDRLGVVDRMSFGLRTVNPVFKAVKENIDASRDSKLVNVGRGDIVGGSNHARDRIFDVACNVFGCISEVIDTYSF